jgi:hypothetical protein
MYTIKADDARQSALFWFLGHFYDWNLDKIAESFKVPFGVIIMELRDMGFEEKTIIALQSNDHPTGFCRVCKLETHKKDEEYCCDSCRKKGKTIKSLLRYGYVPTTWSRSILYNLNNHTVYRIVKEK